jgi:hypothetical protein
MRPLLYAKRGHESGGFEPEFRQQMQAMKPPGGRAHLRYGSSRRVSHLRPPKFDTAGSAFADAGSQSAFGIRHLDDLNAQFALNVVVARV